MMEATRISDAFEMFMTEAPAHQAAWLSAVDKLGVVSKLDPETEALVYIGILTAARLESGLPFHVSEAK